MDFKSIFNFLLDLRKNNNRDWFHDHKDEYNNVRDEFIGYVEVLIKGISEFEPAIGFLKPKDCLFRINRDIRFSKDKTPYNSHFSAAFTDGGKKSPNPGYYIMIKPGGLSYTGGGIWHPASENLSKIRQEIDYNPEELKKVIYDKMFRKVFGNLEGEKLKRSPRGYDEDHPEIELLKRKDFIAGKPLSDQEILKSDFVDRSIETFRMIAPMNRYFYTALNH